MKVSKYLGLMIIWGTMFFNANYTLAQKKQHPACKIPEVVEESEDEEISKTKTDTIIIHDTASNRSLSWEELSEIQEKIYKNTLADNYGKDPIPNSEHCREYNGKKIMVYYNYHLIIRKDKVEQLLNDETDIGWHAGDMDENERSIAICFDGNYSAENWPSKKMLKMAAEEIKKYIKKYPEISFLKGHKDARRRTPQGEYSTICPGGWFDTPRASDGKTGREVLIELIGVNLTTE